MMIDEIINRFFGPDSIGLLPESVSVNDRQEVEQFLNESADVFSDILLAIDSN